MIQPFDFKSTGQRLVDDAFTKVREKFREVINSVNGDLFGGARILRKQAISGTTATRVAHGLGREPKGWLQIYSEYGGGTGASYVTDVRKPDSKYLYLMAGSSHSVDLLVF